jgi:hypothetical protein
MAKCFISYSWDSEEHRAWVRALATDLVGNAVNVLLDQWDVAPGDDLAAYMETSIRESDCVLLVCTPGFARKANESRGGVGYEKTIVTGELFHDTRVGKFVPILRRGDPGKALPSYLKSRYFIDFRKNEAYGGGLEEILLHVYGTRRHQRPITGKPPVFANAGPPTRVAEPRKSKATDPDLAVTFCERCGAVTGTPSNCPGWSSHRFRRGTTLDCCERCGARPGKPGPCPGWSCHQFIGGSGREFCERCGTRPSLPTQCPGWTSHKFIQGAGQDFCERCGAQPGSPTKCPGWSTHKFVVL